MSIQFDYSGRAVIVTGATRGIGKALADLYISANADVLMTGTSEADVQERNRELRDAGVSNARYVAVNFTEPRSLDSFIATMENLPRLDVLVNNAGTNRVAPVEDVAPEDFGDIQTINLTAPFRLCQVAARRMKIDGYGRILNIASIWSVISKPGRAAYTSAKSGLAGLTRCLAAELAPSNVLVNTLSPGFTKTELTASTLSPEEWKRLEDQIPIKRFAEPVEMARVALFLTSEANSYLTGQNLVIDGGFTIV